MTPGGADAHDLTLFTRKVFIVAAVVIGLILLWRVRDIALLVFIAGVLASGIAPAVRKVQVVGRHWTRRKMKRGTAVLIVYLPFLLVIATMLAVVLPNLFSETRQLTTVLPALVEQKLLLPLAQYLPVDHIRGLLRQRPQHVPVLAYMRGVATVVSSIVVVIVMVAYMLLDSDRLQSLFLIFYPAEERARRLRMIRRVSRRMSSWVMGQLLLSAIVGGATFVGLIVLRIPYALPLALLMGVGELVPVIGPVVGITPSLIIALFHSTWQFWSVLVMAIVIQQIENHLLVPRLMGRIVSVSPLSVIIAFMIGATLFGIPGAMMAVPLAAIAQVLFEESFLAKRERRQNRGRPGTLIKEV